MEIEEHYQAHRFSDGADKITDESTFSDYESSYLRGGVTCVTQSVEHENSSHFQDAKAF